MHCRSFVHSETRHLSKTTPDCARPCCRCCADNAFCFIPGRNVGKVNLTVSGEQTDLVVAQKGNANSLLIIPKSEDGWKIGIGVYTKSAFYTASNGATVRVYRYKNSSDYYVEVLDSAGDKAEVTDNCNSEFHSVERFNTALDKNCYTYYAYVSNLDDTYTVLVDGAAITVTR